MSTAYFVVVVAIWVALSVALVSICAGNGKD